MTTMASCIMLQKFVKDGFIRLGVPASDAAICADILIEADRRGISSHGVNRFKPIYVDRILSGIQNPVTEIEILKETPTTSVIDGHNGMGMMIAHKCMEMAIEKAKKYGMGMSVARNSTHYGIAGYYATMATDCRMIGITGTNARPSVAPTFGVEPMLGTNPLTIGLPTDEEFPFVIDCATSISQRGKIEYYARSNQPTPTDMVIDNHGNSMTESNAILQALTKGEAAFAPLGGIGETLAGYKGYGYSTVVEILSSALAAGSYLKMLTGFNEAGEKQPYHLGHFFIAIDTEAFMGAESFRKTAGNILRELRASKRADPAQNIFTAGEKEYKNKKECLETGIPLNSVILAELEKVKKELNISADIF